MEQTNARGEVRLNAHDDEAKFRVAIREAEETRDQEALLFRTRAYRDWLEEQGWMDAARQFDAFLADPARVRSRWPSLNDERDAPDWAKDLTEHQRTQYLLATKRALGILTGTPGTGKSFLTARLIRALMQRKPRPRVAVAAPTGKAAVRITSILREIGVPRGVVDPSTMHQMLVIGRNGHDGKGWGFQHNKADPLRYDFVILEETGMLDASLAASAFSACRDGTHVLLVGDPNQLPPVGHGFPLRDLIAAGVPHGELTEIRRNAGTIVRACAAIRRGELFEAEEKLDPPERNLRHLEVWDSADIVAQVRRLVREYIANRGYSPFDVQVIVPLNSKSPLSREAINDALMEEFFGRRFGPREFVPGMKVICLVNGQHEAVDQFQTEYVANGDMGQIVEMRREPEILFRDPERLVSFRLASGEEKQNLVAAYAITAHRSQGSQYPVVIVVADPSGGRVAGRSWWYTAISRAQEVCITIGKQGVIRRQAATNITERRKTFLREILAES